MFFKTNKEEVVAAFHKLKADRAALRLNADKFAKEYDAVAVILRDSDSVFFSGIKFNNNAVVNRDVWCKPDRQFGISRLRSKPAKKEFQAEFDAELQKWNSLKDKYFSSKTRVQQSEFYKTLSFDWGDLLFSSFACFEYQGYLYIDTSISRIAENATEILGSEYEKAKIAHEKVA